MRAADVMDLIDQATARFAHWWAEDDLDRALAWAEIAAGLAHLLPRLEEAPS